MESAPGLIGTPLKSTINGNFCISLCAPNYLGLYIGTCPPPRRSRAEISFVVRELRFWPASSRICPCLKFHCTTPVTHGPLPLPSSKLLHLRLSFLELNPTISLPFTVSPRLLQLDGPANYGDEIPTPYALPRGKPPGDYFLWFAERYSVTQNAFLAMDCFAFKIWFSLFHHD